MRLVTALDTGSTFAERARGGAQLQAAIVNDLEAWGFVVAVNGTEHTHPAFVSGLWRSTDPTSMSIRYQPDCVLRHGNPIPRSFYVEIKNSQCIERAAYENYMRLADAGDDVFVVCMNRVPSVCYGLVQDLTFEPVDWTQKDQDWPFVDGWITPRANPELFAEKKRQGFSGSGTPFRRIDGRELPLWETFPDTIREVCS